MPIAYNTKQDNTSRRVWKMLENDEVRNGKSRADAKHDCKQMRKMFRYGGSIIEDCNGRAVYVPLGQTVQQIGLGVKTLAEEMALKMYSDNVNDFANQVMFERLTGQK
jgi:hypothetical protein